MTAPDATTDPVEDDHDLLSYTLAGERLAEAVAGLREAVASTRGLVEPDPALLRVLQERLEVLVGAQGRHGAPAITAANKSYFYGWTDVVPPDR